MQGRGHETAEGAGRPRATIVHRDPPGLSASEGAVFPHIGMDRSLNGCAVSPSHVEMSVFGGSDAASY